jgi:nitroreductase
MAAPSAVNMQPWRFMVITERGLLDSLASHLPYAKMLATAPAAVSVCGDIRKTTGEKEREYWVQDCSAATENLLLAAHGMGLGAVWTAVYPVDERIDAVQETLDLPSYLIPLNVVAVGYPAERREPKEKWDPGKVDWY